MSRFRTLKSTILPWLRQPDWTKDHPLPPQLAGAASLADGPTNSAPNKNISLLSLVNPLFACLTEGDRLAARAAYVLGYVINRIDAQNREAARNIIRRFIWQMNVESGNIGWGIPEAFGQTLAQNHRLAKEYHKILFHYIHDKEGDNSYCDYAPLRRSCYTAMGDVVRAWPEYAGMAVSLLQQAAEKDADKTCRQLAKSLLDEFRPLDESQSEKT